MASFELHHLSLGARDQQGLFDKPLSKVEWLRFVFSQHHHFNHRGNEFHWVPHKAGDLLVGVVERQASIKHYESPEDGGRPTESELWEGAITAIDPEHHNDGQKVAFQRGTKIGKASAILEALVAKINEIPDAPYILTIKPIWDAKSFAAFANKHDNILRWVTFDFVVPNMFDLTGKLDEKLKKVGEDTGAQHVKLTLESPDGVKADSPEVETGVAYGAKGQATVTAAAMDGDRYSSTDRVETATVKGVKAQGSALLSLLRSRVKEVFGREDGGEDNSNGDRRDPTRT